MNTEQQRTAFETWFKSGSKRELERAGYSYVLMSASSAWLAWQASVYAQPVSAGLTDDQNIACSSCGLTMAQSKYLSSAQQMPEINPTGSINAHDALDLLVMTARGTRTDADISANAAAIKAALYYPVTGSVMGRAECVLEYQTKEQK